MEIIGYLAAILIGVSLGLIGSGGSILTVPVLVYLFGVDVVLATGYSLFIVGFSSGIGAVNYFKKKLVNLRTAIIFGIPSIISVFLTRAYLVPAIPENLFSIKNFTLTKDVMIMIVFAILMVFAAIQMIKKDKASHPSLGPQKFNYPLIVVEGFVVGALTGLVGAGGGFLIIPALILLSRLPMKEAVGTSLVIIAAKSLIGFWGEPMETIDWPFLLSITLVASAGIFLGTFISKKIESEKLKPLFGWFVLIMGVYIIGKELFF